jgi:hypothetical protein
MRPKIYPVNFLIPLNLLLHQHTCKTQNLSHPPKRFYKKFLISLKLIFRLLTLRWLRSSRRCQLKQPTQAKKRRKRIKFFRKFLQRVLLQRTHRKTIRWLKPAIVASKCSPLQVVQRGTNRSQRRVRKTFQYM